MPGGLAQTDTHRLTLYFFGTGSAALNSQIARFGDVFAKISKKSDDVDRLKATRQAGCPDRLIGTHGEQRGSKISVLIFDPLCSLALSSDPGIYKVADPKLSCLLILDENLAFPS